MGKRLLLGCWFEVRLVVDVDKVLGVEANHVSAHLK